MRALLLSVLLSVALPAAVWAQVPTVGRGGSLIVITKTSGQALRGRVIRELARGFLVRLEAGETVVVDFKDIANMTDVAPGAPPPAKPSDVPAPAAKPEPPAPAECFPACRAGFSCRDGVCVSTRTGGPTSTPVRAPAATEAPPDPNGCFPPCRAGFVCRDEVCVSARTGGPSPAGCSPPCRSGFQCRGSACVPAPDPR